MKDNEQNQRLWQKLFLPILFLFSCFLITPPASAQEEAGPPPSCTVQNTFPENYVYPPSHFGAMRGGGSRRHAGVDFFLPKNTEVKVPETCEVHIYKDGTAIWKTDPNGFGNYMFLNCGNHGGDSITLRYAHIAGYNTDTQMIIQGRTGIETASIPDHYHFEVLIGNVAVDPECVLGLVKGAGPKSDIEECNQCPNEGPADLCDAAVRDALIQHSSICHRGNPKTYNTLPDDASLIDPDRMEGNGIQGDAQSSGTDEASEGFEGHGDDNHVHNHEISPSDSYQGNVDALYPPVDNKHPPKDPPPSGEAGDEAKLVIPGENDVELSGCATDTWTAMVNQAVLETRRELLINQRLIAKPDSVLKYACFDQESKRTADVVGPLFSETDDWAVGKARSEVNIMGETVIMDVNLGREHLDGSINNAVDIMAAQYLAENFNNGFLGETAPVSSSSDCSFMQDIWNAAKCKNADTPFLTFYDLINTDPRTLPANLNCSD